MPTYRKLLFVSVLTLIFSAHFPLLADETSSSPVVQIKKRQNIKVAYDVKEDVWDAGVGKALYYVRGLLIAYGSMGVLPKQLKISIVLHGPTVYWALNEATYQDRSEDPFAYNPNEHVIRQLIALGVSVEICNSTLKGKGWGRKNLLPGVTIVHDAYTRLIDLQHANYSYIRF